MPLKVGTQVVIDDDRGLNAIASVDDTTKTTINNAIDTSTITDVVTQAKVNELVVAQNNVLIIKDSSGTVVKKIYGGEEV